MSARLLAIDSSGLVQRVLRAIIGSDADGAIPVEERIERSVASAAQQVDSMLERFAPAAAFAAFDKPEPWTWRHDRYPAYKATRPPAPPERTPAMRRFWREMQARGITPVVANTAEADDLIGYGVTEWVSGGGTAIIATKDKDMMSLVSDSVVVWDFGEKELRDASWLKNKLGIYPDQVRSYLAMVGDTSDNIPGVKGIGAKTAAALLEQYGDWPTIAAMAGEIEGRAGALVAASLNYGDLSYELAGTYLPSTERFDLDACHLVAPALPGRPAAPAAPPSARMRP